MPPKKIPPHAEEVDDIKRSLDMLTEEVSVVRQQQIAIMSQVEEVKALRLENSEKDKKIFSLENRVDELEQYTRINNIIITGLETKPRSYAQAATRMTGGDTSEEDATSVELQVTAFLNSKGIEIDSDNIDACHQLPRGNKTDKPAIIIRFANRKQKTELLKQQETQTCVTRTGASVGFGFGVTHTEQSPI